MNAVYWATSFAPRLAPCLAICLAICLALVGCGNKGDLFLEKVELTAEQKAVLENTGTQNPVSEEDKTKKNKKKITDTPKILE